MWSPELLALAPSGLQPCPRSIADTLAFLLGDPRKDGDEKLADRCRGVDHWFGEALELHSARSKLLEVEKRLQWSFTREPVESPKHYEVKPVARRIIEHSLERGAIAVLPACRVIVGLDHVSQSGSEAFKLAKLVYAVLLLAGHSKVECATLCFLSIWSLTLHVLFLRGFCACAALLPSLLLSSSPPGTLPRRAKLTPGLFGSAAELPVLP